MHINDLHDEILENLFNIHVNVYLQSRRSLLLTCRQWYNLANSFSSLWRKIACFPNHGLPQIAIETNSLDGLARLISRSGKATYELGFGLPEPNPVTDEDIDGFFATFDVKGLSRCQSLSICSPHQPLQDENEHLLARVFHGCSLDALECLSIRNAHWNMQQGGAPTDWTKPLLTAVERSSPHLRVLKYWGDSRTQILLHRFPGILSRLRRLLLRDYHHPVPWSDLPCLEHLDFRLPDLEGGSSLSNIVAPRLTSLSLEARFEADDLPSSEVFRKLNRLELFVFSVGEGDEWNAPPLPNLTHLGVHEELGPLKDIRADNLEELKLWIHINGGDYVEVNNAHVSPRILRLDISYCDNRVDFGNCAIPLVIWSRLEEIHVTRLELWEVEGIPSPMVEGITGMSSGGQCYPRLRCLTVRYPCGSSCPSLAERYTWVGKLRRIKERREAGGYTHLERLEVGWYRFERVPYELGDASDCNVTEWTDCLLEWDEEQLEGMSF